MPEKKPVTMQALIGAELTKVLHEASHVLSQEVISHEPATGLISPKQKAAQLEQQTNEAFEKVTHDFVYAAGLLLTEIELLSRTNHEINFEKVSLELKQMGKEFDKKTFDELAIKAATEPMFNPQEILKISKETLRALFDAAAYLLSAKRFSDAVKAFALLCSLAPIDYDHWVGYGHSAFQNHDFDIATIAYYQAATLRKNTPWPIIWAANACMKKNELKAAVDLLEYAREIAIESKDKEIQALETQIQSLLTETKIKMKK